MIDKEVLERTLIQKCIELYEKVLAEHDELVKEKPEAPRIRVNPRIRGDPYITFQFG